MQRLFHQVVELAEQMNLMTNLVDNILNILMFAVSNRCDVDKVLKKCFTSTYVFMDFHSLFVLRLKTNMTGSHFLSS